MQVEVDCEHAYIRGIGKQLTKLVLRFQSRHVYRNSMTDRLPTRFFQGGMVNAKQKKKKIEDFLI